MPALAPNSLIAVTGITGFVGSHVGLAALQAGHRVRGTVRSLERAQAIKKAYAEHGIRDIDTRLEFVVVDDLLSVEQYQRAIEGVDGIAHVALPMEGWDHKFVSTAVGVVTCLLRAAKEMPSVKRVVITSSSASVISPPSYVDRTLTEKDWNDEAVRAVERDQADGNPSPMLIAYGAAKTKSEKAAWEFMQEEKPQFDLASTVISVIFGPALSTPSSTGKWLSSLLQISGPMPAAMVPAPQWWLDVRDSGRLHLLCLTTPSASGRRIFGAASPIGWNRVLAILRENFPNAQVSDDLPGDQGEPDRQKLDNSAATEMLGGWIGLDECIIDSAKSFGY